VSPPPARSSTSDASGRGARAREGPPPRGNPRVVDRLLNILFARTARCCRSTVVLHAATAGLRGPCR
jgi:hypothetical protein